MQEIRSRLLALTLGAAAFAGATTLAVPASATLIGDKIDIAITFDHSAPGIPAFTIDDVDLTDVEVKGTSSDPEVLTAYFDNPSNPISFGDLTVDVDDSAIAVGLFGGTSDPSVAPAFIPPFQMWFEGLEWVGLPGKITDVIPESFNFPGFTVSDFGTDDVTGESFIHIDFAGVNFGPSPPGLPFFFSVNIFNIEAEHVPEPATLALLGAGLAVLGFARRKKGPSRGRFGGPGLVREAARTG